MLSPLETVEIGTKSLKKAPFNTGRAQGVVDIKRRLLLNGGLYVFLQVKPIKSDPRTAIGPLISQNSNFAHP